MSIISLISCEYQQNNRTSLMATSAVRYIGNEARMSHLSRGVLVYLLSYFAFVMSGTNDAFANFRLTTIINDRCDKSLKLETRSVKFWECALWCGRVKDCRRFLHSKNNLMCTLYSDGNNCIVNGDSSGYRCMVKYFGCFADKCTCPRGYYGDKCTQIATDCKDYVARGFGESKTVLTNIQPETSPEPFEALCYLSSSASLSILTRAGSCNKGNFNRSLHEYEVGFGNVPWNGWLGFDKILPLVNKPNTRTKLDVYITTTSEKCQMSYTLFSIGNYSSQYTFYADAFGITNRFCGDSIMGSNSTLNVTGRPFSTFDSDLTGFDCPKTLGGGWWFADDSRCSDSFGTGGAMSHIYWRNTLQNQKINSLTFKISYY
ncbi:hypothetical protein LOTGIDRAFT_151987 [Lottia gigantea]|uniref:Fibrinogen C-terminal domain-containing protein n=1 Tax=Lottia gigantea TaxID=225164 RepID=V4BC26_LOTGI|nr:hypothetical protein LOTGIDRAFT_151987 [Lottia gigantea]ESP05181.1 hypothetical protein LOTGIDRAFT_151987 [Lottia gigantea]